MDDVREPSHFFRLLSAGLALSCVGRFRAVAHFLSGAKLQRPRVVVCGGGC